MLRTLLVAKREWPRRWARKRSGRMRGPATQELINKRLNGLELRLNKPPAKVLPAWLGSTHARRHGTERRRSGRTSATPRPAIRRSCSAVGRRCHNMTKRIAHRNKGRNVNLLIVRNFRMLEKHMVSGF